MTTRHDAVQIGCGNRGQTHARALADSDRFEFVAVCDVDGYATRGLYGSLADCLDGTREGHPSDFASALTTHRVAEAAPRSADEGRAVDLAAVE